MYKLLSSLSRRLFWFLAEEPVTQTWWRRWLMWFCDYDMICSFVSGNIMLFALLLFVVYLVRSERNRRREDGRPSIAISNRVSTGDYCMPNGRGTQDASGASAVATAAILTSSESRSESSTNRVDNTELVSQHAPSTIYYHSVVSQPTMFKPGKDIDAWIAKFNVYVKAANVRNKYSLLLTLVDDECVRKLTSSIQEGDEESCF
jgi:hypothetical protein